jgi:electron transport complex protein RnfC
VQDTGISVVSFPTKYPSGGEKQLIYILTGKEIPSGDLPADIGMVCVNIGTTYAVKRAIVDGEPLISRVTTMTGDACGINRNYETLIGTPVSHMLANSEFNEETCSRLVMGGPMMGFSLTSADVPIVKTTNCILAPSYDEIPDDEPAQPCIRCGMCAEACPVSLLPQQLFWYSQADDHERLEAHNLFDCIECGACSYVCPSNIPLVQHYRHSKGEIQKARAEKVRSDHARERFEFHQQRIEQAEKDKEAKRAARREAAEKAKAKAAASSDKSASTAGGGAADIIAAAQARAAAKKVSPEQQQAKFERSIAGAEMRLQMAEEKLAEAGEGHSDEQKNILTAAVEGARQKLEQAKGRLAEHIKQHNGEQVD